MRTKSGKRKVFVNLSIEELIHLYIAFFKRGISKLLLIRLGTSLLGDI